MGVSPLSLPKKNPFILLCEKKSVYYNSVKLLYVATFILFRAKCMHLIDSVELR
jgi:hypothetical protein